MPTSKELRDALLKTVEQLNLWLKQDECDCEGLGHQCGRVNLESVISEAESLLSQPEAQEPSGLLPCPFCGSLAEIMPQCEDGMRGVRCSNAHYCDIRPMVEVEAKSEMWPDGKSFHYIYEGVQEKANLIWNRREGQHARMTEVEALAEARKRWGEFASIRFSSVNVGNGKTLCIYQVGESGRPGTHGYNWKGESIDEPEKPASWEAAFAQADKEGK